MTRNYLSLADIIERNEGKIATYEIEKYIYPEIISALLSFKGGDTIRFYHEQDCSETTELIKYKSFSGLIQNIELKEEKCNEDYYESATRTHLLINGKKYSSLIISSNGYYSESISWELLKTDAELAEEERIEQEQENFSSPCNEEGIYKYIDRNQLILLEKEYEKQKGFPYLHAPIFMD